MTRDTNIHHITFILYPNQKSHARSERSSSYWVCVFFSLLRETFMYIIDVVIVLLVRHFDSSPWTDFTHGTVSILNMDLPIICAWGGQMMITDGHYLITGGQILTTESHMPVPFRSAFASGSTDSEVNHRVIHLSSVSSHGSALGYKTLAGTYCSQPPSSQFTGFGIYRPLSISHV